MTVNLIPLHLIATNRIIIIIIPEILNGYGLSILSTSKGVVTGREAKKMGVGGEVLCSVW